MYYRRLVVFAGKEKKFINHLFYFTPVCGNIGQEIKICMEFIMNIKNKKTVLNDDAALYNRKESASEKEKWQSMSGKRRLRYFLDYYLGRILAVTLVLAVVGSILYTMLSPKPESVFSVGVINDSANQLYYDALQAQLNELLGVDNETEETVFDTGYYFDNTEYQSFQKFSIYNTVGDLDVSIFPLSKFKEYAPAEHFSPVAEYLSSGLYSSLSEYLVESKVQDIQGNILDGTETVYGIDLSGTWFYQTCPSNEPMILVINLAPKNADNIETFLKLLFFPDDVK